MLPLITSPTSSSRELPGKRSFNKRVSILFDVARENIQTADKPRPMGGVFSTH